MHKENLALITGANGHLGSNLVRNLLSNNIPVRASVRDRLKNEVLRGLSCEIVQADITKKATLIKALQGVHTFYCVGAAFKFWSKNPKKEIYDVNLLGAQNAVEAAAEAGVQKIIYVSSIAALDFTKQPAEEANGYNPDRRDYYFNSKNDGEKLAFELAKKNGIELVAVLPATMVGGVAGFPLSLSNNILRLILQKKIPVDTHMFFNWVDVKDVAEGCRLAAEKGHSGERYILAAEKGMSLAATVQLAQGLFPERKINTPAKLPKPLLYLIAYLMETGAKITGTAPSLGKKELDMFYGIPQDFDISKARSVLGYAPKSAEQAVTEALIYLDRNRELLQ